MVLYEDIYNKKFSFGKNWKNYLRNLDNDKIEIAKKSLKDFTKLKNFNNKTFIDIGCGSGLFSLCALLMGAKKVYSFDVDSSSVECAKYLRQKLQIPEYRWYIVNGSILDNNFINNMPKCDIIYSWGVLHHTGDIWTSLDNIIKLSNNNSYIYLALYNDYRGFISSKTWIKVKKFYSGSNKFMRKIMEAIYFCYFLGGCIKSKRNPISHIKNYSKNSLRGMSFYYDMVDWLGGYPYQPTTPKQINNYFNSKQYILKNYIFRNGTGCNEYLFKRYKNGI